MLKTSFPYFQPLNLDIQELYEQIYKLYPAYADFSFGNLVIWLNQNDDLGISILNNNIILKCTNIFLNDNQQLTILGKNDIEETLLKLFEYQKALLIRPMLIAVPEIVVKSIKNRDKFYVKEMRDDFEYIYELNDLAHPEGAKMRKLRREVRKFEDLLGASISIKYLDLENKFDVVILRNALASWHDVYHHSNNDDSEVESRVIQKTLKYGGEIGYKNISVYINGKIEGFMLFQTPPQEDTIILNHIKTNYAYPYIFDYMIHTLALYGIEHRFKYLNFEQDLGKEGLRTHKESLKPSHFFKKYRIEPSNH